MAAQFAPLAITELIPYFLKSPFSCAITMGEQSVNAIMPSFIVETSGPSLAKAPPTHVFGKPANKVVRVVARADLSRNCLRVNLSERWLVFENGFICVFRITGDMKS